MRRLSKATKLLVQRVEELEKPDGISATKWRGVRALLIAIGKHYPKAFPSQVTLATETGYSVRSIQGYQAEAVRLGLLLVKPDAGRRGEHNSWSKTNEYHITIHASSACMDDARLAHKPYGLRPPGIELRSITSAEVIKLSADDFHAPGEKSRQVGEQPEPPRPSKTPRRRRTAAELKVDSGKKLTRPPRAASAMAWRACAEHFLQSWREMIEHTSKDDPLRKIREMETDGHFKSYMESQFFGRAARTPKSQTEVMALIDTFIDGVKRRVVRIKETQSAWMAFIGTWGRQGGYLNMNQAAAANATYVPPQRRQ